MNLQSLIELPTISTLSTAECQQTQRQQTIRTLIHVTIKTGGLLQIQRNISNV
jgi:hypothetical protein